MSDFAIALIVGFLAGAAVFIGVRIALNIYAYYLVDGIGKVLEAIEYPDVASEENIYAE